MTLSDDMLNLPEYMGQVSRSFRFRVVDAVTGVNRGTLTPLRNSVPTLEHDTTSTISRRVNNLALGVDDTEWFNPLTDRVWVEMVLGDEAGTTFSLGRYMVADGQNILLSQGGQATLTLLDEMFIVDQEMEEGFNANNLAADYAIRKLLEYVAIETVILEANNGEGVTQAWGAGTGRGQAVLDLATAGGYFKPWFDHLNRMRFIRVFEPGDVVPDIDLDSPPRVRRTSITFTDDLATAPNRWIVRSNATGILIGDEGAETTAWPAVVGQYDVPASAPYSAAQRGFVIPKIIEAQMRTNTAASVYAKTIGVQRSLYQTCTLTTPADPRHDSYNVVRFNGENWLEIGWSMPLSANGEMTHTLRRAYPSTGEEQV